MLMLLDEHRGRVEPAGPIRFNKPSVTVREIIRARVELEVERQNDQAAAALASRKDGLVVPGPVEVALNGDRGAYGLGMIFRRSEGGRHDIDRLVADAEQGFAAGSYYLLLDDRQADDLDEIIDLERTSEATFLMLTPLQGG